MQVHDAPIHIITQEPWNGRCEAPIITSPRLAGYSRSYDGGWPQHPIVMHPPPHAGIVQAESPEQRGLRPSGSAEQIDIHIAPVPTSSRSDANGNLRQAQPSKGSSDQGQDELAKEPAAPQGCLAKCCESVPRMDEVTVLKRACWCLYCCCCGLGCHGRRARPRIACKCVLCRMSSESTTKCTDSHDGCCAQSQSCCCCLSICHLMPRPGSPCCICCNEICCLHRGQDTTKDEDNEKYYKTVADDGTDFRASDFDHFMSETNVLCFLCCTGCATARSLSVYHGKQKCCCCKCKFSTTLPNLHGCCNALCTCWWCLAQCRFPPRCSPALNPIVECCGCKLRKERKHAIGPGCVNKHAPIGMAPHQQQMS